MEIRRARIEDLEELAKFFVEHDDQPYEYAKRRLKYYIENCIIILALDKKNIIGHLLCQIKEGPFLGVAELEEFLVLSKYRGKGIGRMMMRKAEEELVKYFKEYSTDLRCAYLLTRSNNKNARKLYESEGYSAPVGGGLIGRIFVDNEPDEIVMVKFF